MFCRESGMLALDERRDTLCQVHDVVLAFGVRCCDARGVHLAAARVAIGRASFKRLETGHGLHLQSGIVNRNGAVLGGLE